jgi:hypothetical protein
LLAKNKKEILLFASKEDMINRDNVQPNRDDAVHVLAMTINGAL